MAAPPSKDSTIEVEALIVGGGLVGMTLASALAGAGLPVAVVDRIDPAATVAPEFDGDRKTRRVGKACRSRGLAAH